MSHAIVGLSRDDEPPLLCFSFSFARVRTTLPRITHSILRGVWRGRLSSVPAMAILDRYGVVTVWCIVILSLWVCTNGVVGMAPETQPSAFQASACATYALTVRRARDQWPRHVLELTLVGACFCPNAAERLHQKRGIPCIRPVLVDDTKERLL